MKKYSALGTTAAALALLLASACNSPVEPDVNPTPGGSVVAWFNGTGYTIDLYFPESDSLVSGAYLTGQVPGDILSPEEGRLAVLNSLDCSIQVFDVDSTGSELYSIQLPQGSNPYLMCRDGSDLWVTLLLTAQVARVELHSGGAVTLFDVDANPTSIASDGDRVFVGHGNWPDTTVSGGISVLDAATGDPAGSIQTPDNVCFLRYFESTGNVHAVTSTYTGDGMISIIDPASLQIVSQLQTGVSPGYPEETKSGFVTGDGWFSGTLYLYSESGGYDTWDTGHFSSAGVACLGDTVYVTDPVSQLVLMADCGSRELLDTLPAGTSGPQGITSIQR